MLSNKPYLIRAFYDWIIDSRCTPQIVLDATIPNCHVPQEFIEDGEIMFNISPDAVLNLKIGSRTVDFEVTIYGIVHQISAPIRAVLSITAEETDQGMYFDPDAEEDEELPPPATTSRGHLKLVE